MQTSADAGEIALGVAALAALGLLYALPMLVAARRDVPGLARVVQLNVLLGWTGLVWAYCLLAALRRPAHRHPVPLEPPAPPRIARDRMPDWVRDLPPHERTWRALPLDTAPLPLDPEDR